LKLILIGFGVVNQSLTKVLSQKSNDLLRKYGLKPKIVAVTDSQGTAINPEGLDPELLLRVKQLKGTVGSYPRFSQPSMNSIDVIENVDADVVVEATPTLGGDPEPGLSHIRKALIAKRHVVTTNKGPLAVAMPTLLNLASKNDVRLRFSGTVGAAIPILDLIEKCAKGDKIVSVSGILNGTTNYILTRMAEAEIEMKEALKEAQRLGYAERDPSCDLSGLDTARKLVILANLAMGKQASIKDVEFTGIENITLNDVLEAKKASCMIKLIGSASDRLKVEPVKISYNSLLCVRGAMNAITLKSELGGEITLIGKGAGGPETASAIIRDLIEIKCSITESIARGKILQ
jgi:homoserine dehydrogenase